MHTAATETYTRMQRWHQFAISLRDATSEPPATLNPLDDSFRAMIWRNLTLPKSAMVTHLCFNTIHVSLHTMSIAWTSGSYHL